MLPAFRIDCLYADRQAQDVKQALHMRQPVFLNLFILFYFVILGLKCRWGGFSFLNLCLFLFAFKKNLKGDTVVSIEDTPVSNSRMRWPLNETQLCL